MNPWMPISGVFTRDVSVQRGQVGQPKPEDVSRTAPPVSTSRVCPIREATARRRTLVSTVRGSLDARRPASWGRRKAVLTSISIPLEPTDGCGPGSNCPERQYEGGGAMHRTMQEGVPEGFAERARGQEPHDLLGGGRQPFGRNHDSAEGSEEDPEQVG